MKRWIIPACMSAALMIGANPSQARSERILSGPEIIQLLVGYTWSMEWNGAATWNVRPDGTLQLESHDDAEGRVSQSLLHWQVIEDRFCINDPADTEAASCYGVVSTDSDEAEAFFHSWLVFIPTNEPGALDLTQMSNIIRHSDDRLDINGIKSALAGRVAWTLTEGEAPQAWHFGHDGTFIRGVGASGDPIKENWRLLDNDLLCLGIKPMETCHQVSRQANFADGVILHLQPVQDHDPEFWLRLP